MNEEPNTSIELPAKECFFEILDEIEDSGDDDD